MDFDTTRKGDILKITVQASRIDAACAIRFKDTMRELCADSPPRVLLDLHNVDFLDSSGLGAVVAARKYLGGSSQLELAGLAPKVSKVFRLTRMDSVFTIHPSADAVLGADAA